VARLKVRYLLVLLVLALTTGAIQVFQYESDFKSETGKQAISKIPVQFSEWKGTDIPLEENIFEILETQSIIHRAYRNGKDRVFLSLVHYPETKVDFHAPEACLGGRGVQIRKEKREKEFIVDGRTVDLRMNQLLYRSGNDTELVLYFFKAGDFLGSSYILLRFQLALEKLFTGGKSGSLVRVSTPIHEGNIEEAYQTLTGFLGDLLPFVTRYI